MSTNEKERAEDREHLAVVVEFITAWREETISGEEAMEGIGEESFDWLIAKAAKGIETDG